MKIAWVQLNDFPKGETRRAELFNLIRSKTSFLSEVFLFFTRFPPSNQVEAIKEEIKNNLPSNTHVLFPVRSEGMEKTIELLCKKFIEEGSYHGGTVTQIANQTTKALTNWNSNYAAKLSIVKESFHFYSSEEFCNHKDSLFALHLNTSISSNRFGEMILLCPEGTDCGFADPALQKQLNDSIIAFSFGENGSSLWNDRECGQLINYITYNKKTYLYLCGGKNTEVISHKSSLLSGNFYEIQLDIDSCIIGYFDFTCSTGTANHYTFDSVNGKWEIDYNFARKEMKLGIPGILFYPIIDRIQIHQGIRADLVDFAEHYLNNFPPSLNVIDWGIDNSQEFDIYLKRIASELSKELFHRIKGEENYLYVYIGTNREEETEEFLCSSSNIFRVFVFQNNIQESTQTSTSSVLGRLYSGCFCSKDKVKPDNTAVIFLRVNKTGNTSFPKANASVNIYRTEIPVIHSSVSFAWLNYMNLIVDMFAEKFVNPEKLEVSLFAISGDNSNNATQNISPTMESGSNTNPDISEKQESIDSKKQANRRVKGLEKGDDRDGR